eukprot:356456-Chlamydomonas_euryale.AAC.1
MHVEVWGKCDGQVVWQAIVCAGQLRTNRRLFAVRKTVLPRPTNILNCLADGLKNAVACPHLAPCKTARARVGLQPCPRRRSW